MTTAQHLTTTIRALEKAIAAAAQLGPLVLSARDSNGLIDIKARLENKLRKIADK
jgi:hypothetical protein